MFSSFLSFLLIKFCIRRGKLEIVYVWDSVYYGAEAYTEI